MSTGRDGRSVACTVALLRSAVLGLASGGRSTLGPTALAVAGAVRAEPGETRWLSSRRTARFAVLASCAELVADQLPRAPSRLAGPGLAARLLTGGASGALVTRRTSSSDRPVPRWFPLLGGLTGVVAAFAGARLGSSWRSAAAGRFGQDAPGALVEDIAAITLSTAGVTASRSGPPRA